MALVVDNDPFSTSANSYVDLAEMLEYVSTRVPDQAVTTAWTALTTDQQSMYVVNATRSLDSSCEWLGELYYREQKLDWPRTGVWVDGWLQPETEVPHQVKEATCEMAIWSMSNNGLVAVGQNASFDSIKVGPINIDFNERVGGSADKYFPDIVAMLLRDFGTMTNPDLPGANKLKVARLIRA